MAQKLRHEDRRITVFIDDRDFGPFKVTDGGFSSNVSTDTKKYMGDRRPTIDGTDMGFSGNLTAEQIAGTPDPQRAFDEFRQQLNDRSAAGLLRVVDSWRVPGGSGEREGYRYEGGVINAEITSRDGGAVQFRLRMDLEKRERL